MRYVATGDRDAYGCVRRGDRQVAVRASDALGDDRMEQRVGPLRVEVIKPLEVLRVVCEGEEHGLSFDLTWRSSFPAVDEPQHIQRAGAKLMLEGCRFVQAGSWSGTLRVESDDYEV